jgi:hypothetical protein
LFRRFQRENNGGDPPYFCVSAEILGRLIHTFKEEYITKDKQRRITVELDLHVDEAIEEAKEVMSRELTAIQMRNLGHLDRHNYMMTETHARVQELSLEYGKALQEQLQVIKDSKITEDTLIEEMAHVSQAHRDRIKEMRAILPLSLDEDRLQLQIRCAAAEEKAENLQEELQALQGSAAERKTEKLQKEFEDLLESNTKVKEKNLRQSKVITSMIKEIRTLRDKNEALEAEREKLLRVIKVADSDYKQLKRASQSQMDEDVMVGLKVRMETAENELERLKRKRTDSISPKRVITSILKRPATAASKDRAPPTGKEVPSSSAQQTLKKSWTRKDRWNDIASSNAPPTSSNRDGFKARN